MRNSNSHLVKVVITHKTSNYYKNDFSVGKELVITYVQGKGGSLFEEQSGKKMSPISLLE